MAKKQLAKRIPAQAIKLAKSKINDRAFDGLCLYFARYCYAIPSKYGTAYSAATHAKLYKGTPAYGSFVFFKSPKTNNPGHVGIYVGNGQIISPIRGEGIQVKTITKWKQWGYRCVGWSLDLNGYTI